jgi:hypothetical protein
MRTTIRSQHATFRLRQRVMATCLPTASLRATNRVPAHLESEMVRINSKGLPNSHGPLTTTITINAISSTAIRQPHCYQYGHHFHDNNGCQGHHSDSIVWYCSDSIVQWYCCCYDSGTGISQDKVSFPSISSLTAFSTSLTQISVAETITDNVSIA